MWRWISQRSRVSSGRRHEPRLVQERAHAPPLAVVDEQVVALGDHERHVAGDRDGAGDRLLDLAPELGRVDDVLERRRAAAAAAPRTPAASNVSTAPLRSSRPSRTSSACARWNPSIRTSRARSPSSSAIRDASVDFPPPGGPVMPSRRRARSGGEPPGVRDRLVDRQRGRPVASRQPTGLTTALCRLLSLAKSSSARPYSSQPVAVGDQPVGPDPARPQRGDRRPERRDLGERALDRDLAAEDVERMDREGVVRDG